jgi:hypothetical protein
MESNRKKYPATLSIIFDRTVLAVLITTLMIGLALGMVLTSNVSSDAENVSSRQFFDAMAPDSETCVQYGASAVTMDSRFYVTFNPFSVYVSRPKMQPGCVLRSSDWAILEQRHLLSSTQEQECKKSLNTFGFTGRLENSPQIDCVYRNDSAGNLFLQQTQQGT